MNTFNHLLNKIIMKRIVLSLTAFMSILTTSALSQTNVFDDIIVPSPNHTYLEQAILQEGLNGDLQDNTASLTVFAPDDAAFSNLAAALNTDIAGLLALPNLSDILRYHVLGIEVLSSAINNGDLVQPLSPTNNLKMTVTSGNDVYANQAQVTIPDIQVDNGAVHVLNAVVLPVETVVDVALDNNFTTLATAVIQEELLPVLTDPLASYTVFAPTNAAFDDLANALNTDINGLLALPNLSDVLAYHVLGTEVLSSAINNGDLVQPLSPTNNLKMTVTSGSDVYANQAQVVVPDIQADNGAVHVLDAVVLPIETVVDVALDNNFTTLATAVIQEELLPVLTDPLASYTVFAPTNTAFDDLANALSTDINGLLALPNLTDILTYHVVSGTVLSGNLTDGPLPTLNGQSVTVDLTSGVMINSSTVITPDVTANNGVVHVIDEVLLPSAASLNEEDRVEFNVYPNPASNQISVVSTDPTPQELSIYDINGRVVFESSFSGEMNVDISNLKAGSYIVNIATQKQKLLIY